MWSCLRGGLGLCVLVVAAVSSLGATVFEFRSDWRWRKGTAEASLPDTRAWRERGFDDSGWSRGTAPFYYGEPLEGTLLSDMQGGYTSLYLRKTFVVTEPAALGRVELQVLSDDGFAAWINGHPVLRFNVPEGEIPFSGTALGTFNEPLPTETYEIENFRELLVPGENVIAVQGFNASLSGSSDFVFQMAMEAEVDETPPVVVATTPPEGGRVREVSSATVVFSEPVRGVDAEDLWVNGVNAVQVTAFGEEQYVFEFPAVTAGLVRFEWQANHGIVDLAPRQNPFGGGGWVCTVDPNLPVPGVAISEFMADNDDTLNDEDGDASDWIEIENSSEVTVDMSGWGLTDDPAEPFRWRFPGVALPARGYLVVFASGKDRRTVGGRLHTNFRLNRSSGSLALVRPGGETASEFAGYPDQLEDVSYGRLVTDPRATGYFPEPTPGAPNAEGGPGFAPEIRFSRIGGAFVDPFQLSLSTPDPRATIRYTLNGSVPTETSSEFNASIRIATPTRVRARAYVPGLLPGPIGGEYYVQLNPSAASVRSELPLMVIHSFGRGTVPADGEYPAVLTIQEPRGGISTLTAAPDLRTRVKLNIRGSSTQGLPKRSYRVEFRDEREADRKLSPLGLPAESDWVLYAPNNFEPILIHNPLIYGLSNEIGRYAPRTRMVELYISTGSGAITSSSYAGIYVLMEKIKRGADRVDIDKLEPEHTTAPAVTGGYLVKIDRLDPGDSGLSAGGQVMGYVDPKEEEMEVPQRAAQRTYLRNYLNAFSTALNGANWQDPVLGWRPYVDEASWIDHHILNVVAFNVDALRLSAYFYKPREGPLVFGPLWDFDRALNSTDGRDSNPRVWANSGGTDFFNYPWWSRLFRDPDFWQAWIDRYQALRGTVLDTNHLFGAVDRWTDEVKTAQPREAAKWPGFTTPRGSYANEISSLKTWLSRRIQFMDTNFLAAPVMSPVTGRVSAGSQVRLSGPTGATVYYTVDGTDPRALRGGIASTARVYSGPVRIDQTTTLKARSFNANHRNRTGSLSPPISSSWSGLAEGRYSLLAGPSSGELQVTEIHYRPAAPSTTELAANPLLTRGDFEFLELRNRGSGPIDLFGLRMTRGVQFQFSTSSVPALEPGERLLLVRNRAAFALRYGNPGQVAGEYLGALDGAGESLRLEDGAGTVIIDVTFRDGWHPATDGLGFSLVPVNESAPDDGEGLDESLRWRPSALVGGSPGRADPDGPETSPVVVNEVLAHTDPPLYDGIELHNPSDWPVPVGGWFLTDDRSQPRKYRIPEGTVISPRGYLWLDETQFGFGAASSNSFRLDSLGDSAWVFAADTAGELSGYAHGFNFGASLNGVSFGREVTCDGRELFLAQERFTPGEPNSGPARPTVVITEVHYHPRDILLGIERLNDTALEFVELANATDSPVPLFDRAHPTNTWRLRDAIEFRFPTGVVLAPRSGLLIVNFDPDNNPEARARLVAAYSVPAGVAMVGPYEGSLPNSKSRLELVRPDEPQGPADPEPGRVPWVVVDEVQYSDESPWATTADGGGNSLQRLDLVGPGDRPGAWHGAPPTPGQWPSVLQDADGDGMPDAWEARHCLDWQDSADRTHDPDGDRVSNSDEYLCGTNPRDAWDVLRWSGVQMDEDGTGLVMTFDVKPGRAYRVEVRDGWESGDWRPWADVAASDVGGPVMLHDTEHVSLGQPRFYRIRLVTGAE